MRYDLPIFIIIFSVLLFLSGSENGRTQKPNPIHETVKFTDITKDVGIQFRDENGESGKKYFIEPLGRGLALFDYDNDGDLDLYLVNGSDLQSTISSNRETNRLYRNDDGKYVDVTSTASVGDTGYGLGCCVGDYNNDGHADLYVTNYGPNILYMNNGDGTFSDVTDSAGVAGSQLSSGCAFLDYNADGLLDLYVVNYVQFNIDTNPICSRKGVPTYCTPEVLEAEADRLYHNNGDNTFTDVTEKAGITAPPGKGLGVVCGDVDNDGDIDIFIANDTTPNLLYINSGNGTFTEDALFAGVALSEDGQAFSGMGANLGDYDNDGYLDVVITNFQDQVNNLYRNTHNGFFNDVSFTTGIGEKSLPFLAWGVEFVDFNHDGWLDIFVANGHLDDNIAMIDPVGTYAQFNQLYWNNRGTSFHVSQIIDQKKVSRGTAFGDIDNDGDMDIVVANLKDIPTILRNDGGNAENWISIKLVGSHCARDAIGARVTLNAGDLTQIREVKSGSGYLSQNDMRLHFGLGNAKTIDSISVRWVCGNVDTLRDVKSNQFLILTENR